MKSLKPLNILTINLKNESFHNPEEWSGVYLEANIQPWLGKIFRFIVFRLLEIHFVKLLPPDH